MFDLHGGGTRALQGSLALTLLAPAVLAACAMPLDEADPTGAARNEDVVASTGELGAAPGTLDPSFATRCLDTRARFTVIGGVRAQLLPDGKMLAAASVVASDTGASELALVRFCRAARSTRPSAVRKVCSRASARAPRS
jgi:hypothetical protein